MRKYSFGIALLGVIALNAVVLPVIPIALGTTVTHKVAVVGKAKFTAKGAVVSATKSSITFHANTTSKNAAALKGKDQTISVAKGMKVTKNGKKIDPSLIPSGSKVKVFGVFDKKTNTIVRVTWIKVLL